MSLLIKGSLQGDWLQDEQSNGEFVRQDSQFRHWITPDGTPGPSGKGGFKAESGRYHLYVSLACPWAHRTLIYRKIKGLEPHIDISVVHPYMGPKGWSFDAFPDSTGDRLYGKHCLHELYTQSQSDYTGIITVPVLWDKQTKRIVNNESSEIIRMFNSAFDSITHNPRDFYPADRRRQIDEINTKVYEYINNGVYRCGFATTQEAYERAFDSLFSTLDELEGRLMVNRYLTGEQITEADWRLLPTLLRFDPVYYSHFKCNLRRIRDYQNLSNYMRELYQWDRVAETFNLRHVKQHYYTSHESLNPSGVVPKGPELDYQAPHNRDTI